MSVAVGSNADERRVHRRRPPSGRLSVLLLCDDDKSHASTLLEHIDAFRRYSAHDVRTFNPRFLRGSWTLDLREFDVVVIHYSLCIVVDNYLSPRFRTSLRDFQGLKVQFIQDDYRWVNRISDTMRDIGLNVLFTLVPPDEIPKVWSPERLPGVITISTLAGYVPDSLVRLPVRPLDERPIDIGYRGRELPYWIGRLGQDKVRIAQGVLARAEKYGLRCDIAWTESDRIYGPAWTEFLASCRAILGTESGASITDFDDSIESRVRMYLAQHPGADFEEVHHAILNEFEGNVRMNVISPRIFEAIALRTPMILFPGEYSGVIRPWAHYIPLEKDFSNMDEVAERVRDTSGLEAMRNRAYDDVVRTGQYSLRTFVREFDDVIERHVVSRRKLGKIRYYGALAERRVEQATVRFWHRHRPTVDRARALPRRVARITNRIPKGLLAVRLIMTDRVLRRVLWEYVKDTDIRRQLTLRKAVADLLRLGILRRHRGTPSGSGFWVDVSYEPAEGTVVFLSVMAPSAQGRPWSPDASPSPAPGSVKRIVWDHSAIADSVHWPPRPGPQLSVPLDPHGVYEFRVIEALTRRPAVGRAVLTAVLAHDDRPRSRG
jgi:hypothetical protein